MAAGQTAPRPVLPGDRLEIVLPDVKEIVHISARGVAVIPVVGAIPLLGLTASQAEDSVTRALGRMVSRPDIRVSLLRRIIIDGAVNGAAVLFVDETVGLAAAIALAGGVSEDADVRRIELWRAGARIGRFSLEALDEPGIPPLASSDHILVRRSPWVVRNAFSVASLMASFASTIVVLLTR